MKNDLKLVKIDTKYCDYLRLYDNKVPYNFENKALRPFVGVLFEVNSCKYFAPLSSPKPKHLKMKNTIDFLNLFWYNNHPKEARYVCTCYTNCSCRS